MGGMLTIGWRDAPRDAGGRRALEIIAALAAGALVIASSAATVMEQSSLDAGDGAMRSPAAPGSATLPGGETAIGAYTGVPYTYPSVVRIGGKDGTDFTIDPVHWYTDPFHNPVYYGARVFRWFAGGRTGAMLDFTHSKAIAQREDEASFSGQIDGKPVPPRARISDIVKKLEFSHGHNMLTLNGLLRLPGIGARLSPYVGAGAGVLLPHTEVELAGSDHSRTYEYNYAGPVGQALVGIEVRLARMSVFVEYKFTYGHYGAPLSQMDGSWLFADLWRQLNRWRNGEPPPGGHVSTEVVSHQVIGGIVVRFASTPAAAR